MASTQTHDEVLIQRVHIVAAKQAQVAVDLRAQDVDHTRHAGLAGVVSLHGGLAPGKQSPTAARVRTPVLVLNGADDKAVPDADILAFEKEMDAAGADWQFVDFSGAVHCFAEASAGTDPASNCRYDERAAKRAYRMMDDFFRERFAAD